MAEKEKIPIAIYQLDRMLYEGSPFRDIVTEVIRKINERQPERTWEPQPVNNTDYLNRVMVYSLRNRFPPGWRRFLTPALARDASLLTSFNIMFGFICFIHNDPEIFVVTGGMGSFQAIDMHVNQHFGLDVLVRIIQKNSPVIKGIGDRGVTGVLLGQSRHFREDQRLSNEDAFGRIYKEVKADLQERILVRDFHFSPGSLSRIKSGCLAKTSFKINKAISFAELVNLTASFNTILARTPNFALNKVLLIDKRKKQNHALLDELKEHFVEMLYEHHRNGQAFDVDLLNKDYESYFDADSYELELNTDEVAVFEDPPTLRDVVNELRRYGSLLDGDVTDFKHSVLLKNLSAIGEDDEPLSDTVLKQLHGEMAYNGKHYFYVDEDWYEVHSSFIADLNRECESIIAECWDDRLISEVFDVREEGDYNRKFLNQPGWVVLDTVTPEHIELCDLLHYEPGHLALVHVKQGFNNSLRDLCAQITIAANRLHEDSRENYRFVESVESHARGRSASESPASRSLATQAFPTGGLPPLFQGVNPKNISFCLAVVDTNPTERPLNGRLSAFHSNIAKYFLIQLHRAAISLRYDFKIIQLRRS